MASVVKNRVVRQWKNLNCYICKTFALQILIVNLLDTSISDVRVSQVIMM